MGMHIMVRGSRMMRCVIAAGVSMISIARVAAGAKIVTDYDQVTTGAAADSPSRSKHYSRTYELLRNGGLLFSSPDLGASTHRLRDSGIGKTPEGLQFKWLYRVENGSFVVFSEFPGWTLRKTVVTDGKSSCRLTAQYKKKPGHEYFEIDLPGKAVYLSDMHAENLTCAIAQTPD
jgi:hypothetical protein